MAHGQFVLTQQVWHHWVMNNRMQSNLDKSGLDANSLIGEYRLPDQNPITPS